MDVPITCACPRLPDGQARHDTDTVTLRERLDFRRAAAIKGDVVLMKMENPDCTAGEALAVISEGYLRQGIESWTLVSEDDKPLEVTPQAIDERILPNLDAAFTIADAADDLYAEAVMRPLLGLASPSSRGTPMESSTSAEPSPSETPESRSTSPTSLPTRSSRSSTSTTPTAGTARTTASRAGDSSSSRSSISAA